MTALLNVVALASSVALAHVVALTLSDRDRDDVLEQAAVLWAVKVEPGPRARVDEGGVAWRGEGAESCAVDWSVSVIEEKGGKGGTGGGSCVPAHTVRALQRQGLGLVRRGGAGGAAEGGAVGGRGVTR